MQTKKLLLATLLASMTAAHAAGPLLLTDHPTKPVPLRWDTSKPVQVYTDIGNLTYRDDGTVFLNNAQADAITAFALKQWSDVPTSTWKAVTDPAKFKKFDKVPSIGVDVKDGETAKLVYGQPNEGGMYVIYDQEGLVLEEYFGVPRDQVLGIAFAEMGEDSDGDGYPETITKATAVMNGWFIVHEESSPDTPWLPPADTGGKRAAGIFTHEFGHAINMSHSQVNGPLGYFSEPVWQDMYPGVKGCVAPVHSWNSWDDTATRMDPKYFETMFPFINSYGVNAAGRSPGVEQSTVDRPDDIAAISDLYPSATYLKTRGSIAGTLYLKDGRTQYSGINIIARNVSNPLGDAISAMTGDKTQGKIGPDGRFRINNLTPGQKYVLYTEEIVAGGYPTEPTTLVSVAEYWNTTEQANAAADGPCVSNAITAEAGVTKTANFYFNGYKDGVQYTPVVNAYLTSMSKDGERAGGQLDTMPFMWSAKTGIQLPPAKVLASTSHISRDGGKMLVQYPFSGRAMGTNWDGSPRYINSAAIWDTKTNRLTDLGSLNGDTCGGESNIGVSSSAGFQLDGRGERAVGLAYVDDNGDGMCQGHGMQGGEILPVIWDAQRGMRQLSMEGIDLTWEPWHRAQAISANGRVVLGSTNGMKAYAWIDEGKPIDLDKLVGARHGGTMTPDGSRVPLTTWNDGVVLWNATLGTGPNAFRKITPLKWCVDMPYSDWVASCEVDGPDAIQAMLGPVPVIVTDISDDGKMMIGRAGDFVTGIAGVMWLEDLGWIKFKDFFRTQGVPEAFRFGLEHPSSINARGNEMVGGLPGVAMTWYVDMKKAFVCKNGRSQETSFPEQFVDAVKHGALMGRCEHL